MKHYINNKGATFVEIIVAVSLFAVVMLLVSGIFVNVIRGQRDAIASQNTQESLRFIFEMMGKEIRMAKNSDTECESTATNKLYNVISNADSDILYFKNNKDECVFYYVDEASRLKIIREDIELAVTPDEIEIVKLKFFYKDNLIGVLPQDRIQPRITILMEVRGRGDNSGFGQSTLMQTTISSRSYEP